MTPSFEGLGIQHDEYRFQHPFGYALRRQPEEKDGREWSYPAGPIGRAATRMRGIAGRGLLLAQGRRSSEKISAGCAESRL